MKQLKNLLLLLFLSSLLTPAIASVNGLDMPSCGVFSEEEKPGTKDAAEDEEPECE